MNELVNSILELKFIDGVIYFAIGFFIGKAANYVYELVRALMYWRKQRIEHEKNKCEHNNHSWVEIPIVGNPTLVCQKCYWCPTLEIYYSKTVVDAHVKFNKIRTELEEHFNTRLEEIAKENNMTKEQLEKLVEDVASIKKDFIIERMNNNEKGSNE